MAIDWTALKLEYLHSAISLRALAEKHGVKPGTVMARASRDGWDRDRKSEAAKVTAAASEALVESRSDQLAKFNEADLRVARAVRAKAAALLAQAEGAAELRSLASAFESAQRIGRLALGAETESVVTNAREGVLVIGPVMSPEEWAAAAKTQQEAITTG